MDLIFSTTKSEMKSVLSALSTSVLSAARGIVSDSFLLEGRIDSIEATTTSIHSTANLTFEAVFENDFTLCLPFKRINKLVPSLAEEEINIYKAKEDGWVILTNGKSKHKIPYYDPESFPKIEYEEFSRLRVPILPLYKAIKACNIATSKSDKASWKLACIGLKIQDDRLKLRSCDGVQISMATIILDQKYDEAEALIPQQAVNFLLKFVNEKSDDYIDIVLCKNHIVFEKESGRLIMTLVAGVFPDIEKLILPDLKTDLTTSVGDLLGAVKRTQTVLSDDQRVTIAISGNELNILAQSKEGKALEVVDCVSNVEERVDIGCMANQIENFLSEFSGDVRIGIESEKIAIHFRPLEIEDYEFVYLTMPTAK